MHTRVIKPEILDSLPEGHPAAEKNRRDIILLGRLSGNYKRCAQLLAAHLQAGDRVLELGAGGGGLGRIVRKTLGPRADKVDYTGLDLWSAPDDWPSAWGWCQGDLLDFSQYDEYSVFIGNFILHQFDDDILRSLFDHLRNHARLMIFTETARRPLHVWQLRLAYLLGINYVTRHDGKVSIEAGFRPGELPALAQLDEGWQIEDGSTFMGCYWMVARRTP